MIGRNINSIVFGLTVAATLAASSVASAQEAIMLERIGAVRMATPTELRAAEGRSVATDARHEPVARAASQRVGAAN